REVLILPGDLADSAELAGVAMQSQRMKAESFALITFVLYSNYIRMAEAHIRDASFGDDVGSRTLQDAVVHVSDHLH
ncbi:MAG: hypothetical protein QG575_1709, partial [Euryarchaeota archaeon]|nr:hypothetical protein [Euryarchaeota archaeon]